MPSTAGQSQPDAIRKELDRVARLGSSISPALSQAIKGMLAALDYADDTLVDAHLNSALEALCELVQNAIHDQLEISESLQETLRTAWREQCTGRLCIENLDPLGKEIETLIDERLKVMMDLRNEAVKQLVEENYVVENAAGLEKGIEDLQKFKKDIFKDWPWSNSPLPPVNRKMVAESRAAIARGEGEPIQHVIRRLGGDSSSKAAEKD